MAKAQVQKKYTIETGTPNNKGLNKTKIKQFKNICKRNQAYCRHPFPQGKKHHPFQVQQLLISPLFSLIPTI